MLEVNEAPVDAPANFAELEPKVVLSDGDGLWERWHGSGLPTDLPCGGCENVASNRQIYGNWGHSYPNGNSWDDSEIVCGACGRFTRRQRFTEG